MNEEIIQTLLQEASSQILEGISPQEVLALSAEFEHLLTICIGTMYLTPFPENDERALGAGRCLIEEICSVPPEDRLQHLQRELLVEELGDLDADAWDTAETSLRTSPDLSALQAQARATLDQINDLWQILHKRGPAWEQSFTRTLSEASQDCLFVLGESPYCSFRVGRAIRFMQDTGGHWPPAWYEELWLQKDAEGE